MFKQECIPVGCLPAARRPYAGVCFLGGSAWSRGVPPSGGVSLVPGGSAWSWGGVCLVPGGRVLHPGGVPQSGGVPPSGGGMASQHALRQTPSPPWTDTHL